MRHRALIRTILYGGVLAAILTAAPLRAQIRIIAREQLDSVANPPLASGAQALRFEQTQIKAGGIDELAPPALHLVKWSNTSDKPMIITHITTSCGCLTATHDRQPVKPGDSSTITIRFNPKGEAGQIDRKLFVYTQLSSQQPSAMLRFTASVIPSKRSIDGYPHTMGSLELSRVLVRFAATAQPQEAHIACRNAGEEALTISYDKMLLPPGFSLTCEPATLESGAQGKLIIRYQPTTASRPLQAPLLLKGLNLPPNQRTISLSIEKPE